MGVRASRVSYCFEVTDEAFGEPVGVLAGEVVAAGKDMLVRIGVKRHVTDGLSHASDLELDCGRVRQIERATPRGDRDVISARDCRSPHPDANGLRNRDTVPESSWVKTVGRTCLG